VYASRPEAVPQAQRELVFAGKLEKIVEVLIERVLFPVVKDSRH
jgi:hypothetical protein